MEQAQQTTAGESPAEVVGGTGQQYLSFSLAGNEYGVDILRVQEIRGWEAVTRIPNAPDYVRGVLNLRGAIVPIYDLRMRFGMPFREYSKDTVVIVLGVHSESSERSVGIVVDAVSDVLNGHAVDVRKTPEFGEHVDTQAISGLATVGNKMVSLLDVDRLIGEPEQGAEPVSHETN